MLNDLVEQQQALASVADSDFRSSSLNALVGQYLVPGSVLDVGCGTGAMVAWLTSQGYDARGIDSSDEIVEAAHAYLECHGCDPGRVAKQPLEDVVARGELADNVLSMDCLEHQADDLPMFLKLVEALRPGGRLVITVPAVPALFSERDRIVGHYRRYTKDRLRELATAAPLKVDELRYWNITGVGPTWIYAHVLRKAINEQFRYGKATLSKRLLRKSLAVWFTQFENRVRPPVGLTLIMAATRLAE